LLLSYGQLVLFQGIATSEQSVEVHVGILEPERQPLVRVGPDGADLSNFCARRGTDLAIQIGRQAERNTIAWGVEQIDISPRDLKCVVAVVGGSGWVDLAGELRAEPSFCVVGAIGIQQSADPHFPIRELDGIRFAFLTS